MKKIIYFENGDLKVNNLPWYYVGKKEIISFWGIKKKVFKIEQNGAVAYFTSRRNIFLCEFSLIEESKLLTVYDKKKKIISKTKLLADGTFFSFITVVINNETEEKIFRCGNFSRPQENETISFARDNDWKPKGSISNNFSLFLKKIKEL